MKIHPQSDNSIINCSIIYVLLLLLLGCNGRPETGSCNQFCGDTQRISVQTRDQCAALGKASGCPTQWLPHGANPDDRNAWITVYPVPEVQVSNPGPDTTPPPQPDLAIELTANNEILLHISPGDGSQKDSYEVTRNGAILPSKYSDKYTYRYDLLTDELAKYCYAVVAIDPSGNRSVSSAEHCLTSPVSPLVSSTDFLQSNQTTNNSVVGSDGTIYGGLRLNALNPDGTLKWTSSLPILRSLTAAGATLRIILPLETYSVGTITFSTLALTNK